MAARKKQSFEEALKRLEEIVAALERGDTPLGESMKLFEEGIRLSNACYETLQKAEQKITFVTALKKTGEEEP